MREKSNSVRMISIALLIAIIVVLQVVSSLIKIGTFSITLTLIPIVVGAAMYGITAGAVLGAAFGVIVLILCIMGLDPGGFILWGINPFLTAGLCILKGVLAGAAAGLVFSLFSKKNLYLGVACAALVCPLVNTGIFIAGMMLCFQETLVAWAGGTSVLYFAFIGLTGVNFLIEVIVDVAFSPAVVRIIKAI